MVVVVGLQTVGVVLIVATLITPAAAARQWTDRLGTMVLLAAGIGAASGAVGSLASAGARACRPGRSSCSSPACVLIVSLLAAPGRGIVWGMLRERRLARASAARTC